MSSGRWGAPQELTRDEIERVLVERSRALTHWYVEMAAGRGVPTSYGMFLPSIRGQKYAARRLRGRQRLEGAYQVGEEIAVRRADGAEVFTRVRIAPWSLDEDWMVGVWDEPWIARISQVRPLKERLLACCG